MRDATVAVSILPHPPAPRTLRGSRAVARPGRAARAQDAALRRRADGAELARRLGLRFSVIEPALDLLKRAAPGRDRRRRRCSGAPSYRYRITDAGRTRAALFLEKNHYVGVAPVPLAQYRELHGAFEKRAPRHGDARARPPGLLASRHQRPRARSARPGRSTPATRCSSTARPATARRSSRRRFATCSTATSRSRTRSRSRAQIIRALRPGQSTRRSTTDEPTAASIDGQRQSTAAGCAAAGRW